ncbi:sigma-70 family RNA polymerase sigma factor [Stieleria mannarensis]|uniref:sigma-70 family RNA polymerase sigma factor n=1 Tax=Stieleria mannarensis TaxID=2755585 RepID=UPI001602B762|nr:sigma-70 family RNA polymerase sigma factor [Rhodopirellula sp. JC639]
MDTNSRRGIERLIADARSGDNSALGKVLESFHAYLELLAKLRLDHKLQGKVSPSDVVQETFLSAKQAFANFRGQSERELMAWLRSILATEIAGQIRYYNRHRRAVTLEKRLSENLDGTSAGLPLGVADPAVSPSVAAAKREAEVMVADALSRLSDDHREVIILHSFQQQTFPEVAARMGRSTDAVKSLWVRALANLRKAMTDDVSRSHGSEDVR